MTAQCPYKAKLRVGQTGHLIDVDCALPAGHRGPCKCVIQIEDEAAARAAEGKR